MLELDCFVLDEDRDIILALLEDVILTLLLDFTVELDEYFFKDDEEFAKCPEASSFRQRTENPKYL